MSGRKLGAGNRDRKETKPLPSNCSLSSKKKNRKDPNIVIDCGKDSQERADEIL